MNSKIKTMILLSILAIFSMNISYAAKEPCSGKKGGIARCDAGKFICKDGSVSQSKKKCGSEDKQPKKKAKKKTTP